jgi:hypothetical protein
MSIHALTGGLTAKNQAFLERWHAFVSTGDESLLPALLAEDVALHAPLYWKVRRGRAEIALILGAVVQVFGPLEYRRVWASGDELALEFATTIMAAEGTVQAKGIDLFTLDADGRIAVLEVMLRPPNALAAFRVGMELEVARRLAAVPR